MGIPPVRLRLSAAEAARRGTQARDGRGQESPDVLDPRQLFSVTGEVADLGQPVMIEALTGFVDAGNATRLAREHLLASLDARPVLRFDLDQLMDYRSRRPLMQFDGDHWESYDE